VSTDDLLRAGAVLAAVAILAAPYRQQAAAFVAQAWTAATPYRGAAARVAAACLLLAAAWGRLPSLPALPQSSPVVVATPTAEVMKAVAGVEAAMANVGPASKSVWREAWRKAAIVVEADRVSGETHVFPKTAALRSYVTLVLDIAWRRIGGHKPGSVADLRGATEAAYAAVVGDTDVPVTPEVREMFAALADGMVWAAR
jgi:hypothetical protein